MTRPELVSILADLVRHHHLTLAEARAVMDRYDTGVLQDDELPTATAEPPRRDGWIAALMYWLMLTVRGNQARDLLRNQFEAQSFRLGLGVSMAVQTVPAWQRGMQTALTHYATRMAVAGSGKLPSAAVQATVESQLDEQWPFLQRFATQIMARGIMERPMSGAEITSRSVLYGGVGWGAFWRGAEPDAGYGRIVYYVSREDGLVCGPCFDAEQGSPYLEESHPYPGEICLGGGRCRCSLRFEYAPEIYTQLAGARAA